MPSRPLSLPRSWLSRVTHSGYYRAEVNNPSVSRFHHAFDQALGEVKGARQITLDHPTPFGGLHSKRKIILIKPVVTSSSGFLSGFNPV